MEDEYFFELKIPKERVAVLIGKDGTVKKDVEEATKTTLDIESKEGDVIIKGGDSLGVFVAKGIIKAVGRGFNPEIALLLLKSDYAYENLHLYDYLGRSKSKLLRMKGRVIGSEGKTRKAIEDLTETYICVYGKTIGIIGFSENVALARRAIESLLNGSPHASVYKWLEKKRVELKRRELQPIALKKEFEKGKACRKH